MSDLNRLCTICARGGSKGVPGKNLRPLLGIPMISHSIRQAFTTGLFTQIAVSSDSLAILEVAEKEGALAIRRPAHLARDLSPKTPAILHALNSAEKLANARFSTLVDLDATSPLRLIQDIFESVEMLESRNLESVFTAAESGRSPYFNQVMRHEGKRWGVVVESLGEVFRRQDAPATFDMNASIYVWSRDAFVRDPKVFYERTEMHKMPQERSLDVDSECDFELVEFLMSKRYKSKGVSG